MSQRSRLPQVLVFAESLNDSKSIAHRLVAVNVRLDRRVKAVPRPTSLTRGAGPLAVRDWVDEVRRAVEGYRRAGTAVTAVLIHRDADRHDPRGDEEQQLRDQLDGVGEPVVPVRTIEA